MAKHNDLGALGEDIASDFLGKKGFEVLHRNYRKPWGELDIVAQRRGVIHFVEVKSTARSVTHETIPHPVTHETGFQPEDAVTPWKVTRLRRVIQSYLAQYKKNQEKWVFDIIAVFVDQETKKARVRFRENVVL